MPVRLGKDRGVFLNPLLHLLNELRADFLHVFIGPGVNRPHVDAVRRGFLFPLQCADFAVQLLRFFL